MTFTLTDSSTITQSGIDTSYSGLSGLSGVTSIANGNGFIYLLGSRDLNINGSVSIGDPSKESVICQKIYIAPWASISSGSFATDGTTPLYGGTHFIVNKDTSSPADDFSLDVSGSLTLIGGEYTSTGAIHFNDNSTIRMYGVSAISPKTWNNGATSTRIRSYAANVILQGCSHYRIGFDMFSMPSEFSVKGFKAEYLAQYLGSQAGGADAKFTASALSNVDGKSDFDNYFNGWVELYNSKKGANLNVISSHDVGHLTPLFQEVNITTSDLSGIALSGVSVRCKDQSDANAPTAAYTTYNGLKTWDFVGVQTYSGSTDTNGKLSLSPVLQVYHQVYHPLTTITTRNLRFPSSTASFKLCGYKGFEQIVSVVLGSDTAMPVSAALTTPGFLTLTEAQSGELTGIALTASGATSGSAVLSSTKTTAEVWQYYRWWISRLENFDSTDIWRFDGTTLNVAGWNARIDVGSGLTTLAINISFAATITINNTSASSAIALVPISSISSYSAASTGGGSISVQSIPVIFSGFPAAANASGYTPQSVLGIKNQRTSAMTTFDASSGSVSVSMSTLGIAGDLFTVVADARGYYRSPLVADIPIAYSGVFDFSNLFKQLLDSDGLPICGTGITAEMAKLVYNQSIGTFEIDGGAVSFASVVQKVEDITSTQSGLSQFDTNILRQLTFAQNPYARTVYLPSPLKIQANSTTATSPVFTNFVVVVTGDSTADPYTHSTRPEIRVSPTKIIVDAAAIANLALIPALL